MVLRTDPDASRGRTGVREIRADPELRALLAAVDGGRPEPVGVAADGGLTGELAVADGAVFLPEQHPADVEAPRDRVGAGIEALKVVLVSAIVVCLALTMSGVDRDGGVLWQNFVVWLGLYGAAAVGLARVGRTQIRLHASRERRGGNPGVFLLRDRLVVRRGGACDIFPRQAIMAIDEAERARPAERGAAPVRYPVTRIVYQGPHGSCEYSLDVGPPRGSDRSPATARAEQVRMARLRRLQAWLHG